MPSSQHEHLVEMFRTRGELAPALLEICAALQLPHACAELAASDLSQPTPTEYRADAVIELRGRHRDLVAAVIVEVQLRRDPRKRFSWPVYLSALRARRQCDVVLFVLTLDPAIARWARQPIETGHPGFTLQPIALSLDELPRSISREQAQNVPELAVLSAIAHRDPDAVVAAIRAIKGLPTEQTKLYMELILKPLPDVDRRIVEARMKDYVFKDPWVIKHFIEPVERAKVVATKAGMKAGRKEGRKEGRGDGLQDALTVLVRDKLKAVPRPYQAAIRRLEDPRVLTQLISAVGRAPDAERVRQVLSSRLKPRKAASKSA